MPREFFIALVQHEDEENSFWPTLRKKSDTAPGGWEEAWRAELPGGPIIALDVARDMQAQLEGKFQSLKGRPHET